MLSSLIWLLLVIGWHSQTGSAREERPPALYRHGFISADTGCFDLRPGGPMSAMDSALVAFCTCIWQRWIRTDAMGFVILRNCLSPRRRTGGFIDGASARNTSSVRRDTAIASGGAYAAKREAGIKLPRPPRG